MLELLAHSSVEQVASRVERLLFEVKAECLVWVDTHRRVNVEFLRGRDECPPKTGAADIILLPIIKRLEGRIEFYIQYIPYTGDNLVQPEPRHGYLLEDTVHPRIASF